MSKTYVAANGQELDGRTIDRWCEAYERGEFPEGEHTVGPVVEGRPPMTSDNSAVISIKVPKGMKIAAERNAKAAGMSLSAYVRSILAEGMLTQA